MGWSRRCRLTGDHVHIRVVESCSWRRPSSFVIRWQGRWCRVTPRQRDHLVSDLVAALDVISGSDSRVGTSDESVWIDRRRTPVTTPLLDSGLRHGSIIETDGESESTETYGVDPVVRVTVLDGVDTARRVDLVSGRHVLGSAPDVSVRVEDERIAPRHFLVDIGPGPGFEVSIIRLAPGRVTTDVVVGDTAPWSSGERLDVGGVGLCWELTDRALLRASIPTSWGSRRDEDPWRITVERRGRLGVGSGPPVDGSETPADRTRDPSGPSPIPALIGFGTSGMLAVVTGSMTMLIVGGVGALGSGAWWASGRWRTRRRDRRRENQARERRDHEVATLRQQDTPLEILMGILDATTTPWERRARHHHDAYRVVLGRGLWNHPRLGAIDDVPVTVDLEPGRPFGLAGPGALAMLRSVLAQLVVHLGSVELGLEISSGVEALGITPIWRLLPHSQEPSVTTATNVSRGDRHRLLRVMTIPELVSHELSEEEFIVLIDERPDDALAAWCPLVVRSPSSHRARLVEVGTAEVLADMASFGISNATTEEVFRAIAGCCDPVVRSTVAQMPPDDRWWPLHHGADSVEALRSDTVRERWQRSSGRARALIGVEDSGVVEIDLARDGPHGLIAGTTGSGKSELLRLIVVGLAWWCSPDEVQFVLVDFKGGAAFDRLVDLPHVVATVTDLDDGLARRMLTGLDAEVTRRERLLRRAGCEDLDAYRLESRQPSLARLVVVVDEFATLASDHPEALGSLVSLAQRGRSLGIHLILATQRPAGVVREDVRANTDLRLCLRVQDRADALDVVGDPRPATFERRFGQGVLRCGSADARPIDLASLRGGWNPGPQSLIVEPWDHVTTSEPSPSEGPDLIEVLVDALARADSGPPRHAPFLGPLPEVLTGPEIEPGACGLLDDPARQARRMLRWEPDGHLVVVGAMGSGLRTTLVQAVAALDLGADAIIVIGGDPGRWAPYRVMNPDDAGSIISGLTPPVAGTAGARRVLVIEDLGMLRPVVESGVVASHWTRLIDTGPSHGVVVAVGVRRSSAVSAGILARTSSRWLLHPSDPLDAAMLGVTWPYPAGTRIVPGRLVDVGSGLEGQILAPGNQASRVPSTI